MLGKFSDLNSFTPEIRGINQQLLSEKGNLWPYLASGRAYFCPFFLSSSLEALRRTVVV